MLTTILCHAYSVMESDLSGIDLAQGNHHDHSEQPYRISDSK